MRKSKARCDRCGRLTSVSRRTGLLHAHNDPGWQTRCPETKPVATTAEPAPPGPALWEGDPP